MNYVLVKFAKKQHMSYDAGRVVGIDKREDEMQTTYMKRNDMHKNDAVTFRNRGPGMARRARHHREAVRANNSW